MAKTKIKIKTAKRARKIIKDKAIVNFLLEHMTPVKLNFPKIKIPSFLNQIDNEGKKPIDSNVFPHEKVLNDTPFSGVNLLNSLFE